MWWKKGGDFVGLNCFLKLDWNLWCIFEFLSGLPCPFIWCCQIQNFLFDRVKYEFHSFPPLLWKKTLFFEVLDHIICHFFEKCLDKFWGLQFSIPYSREQKHVLLFRKSETWLLKVSITNMPHIFSKNKTFFVFQDRKLKFSASFWFRILWILTKFQLIWTTFIFWSPCY